MYLSFVASSATAVSCVVIKLLSSLRLWLEEVLIVVKKKDNFIFENVKYFFLCTCEDFWHGGIWKILVSVCLTEL